MNLARHAAVLWRFRGVTAAGLLLGILLAVYASYDISTSGMVRRGHPTYTSRSQLLVTQPGCPECRSVLPVTPPISSTSNEQQIDPNQLEFADPNRFNTLADLYTKLIVSDEVLASIPGHPSAAQIVASPLPAVSGAPILPIIQLDTSAGSAEAAQRLNSDTGKALRNLIARDSRRNGVSTSKAVQFETIQAPSPGALAAGASYTASILALLLVLVGTVALTHLLENLRNRRAASQDEVGDEFESWTEHGANGHANGHGTVDEDLAAAFAGAEWDPPRAPQRRPE
jgi:hypothetical protein